MISILLSLFSMIRMRRSWSKAHDQGKGDLVELLVANPEGLTRDEMAEKLGVSPQRVGQITRAKKVEADLCRRFCSRGNEDFR